MIDATGRTPSASATAAAASAKNAFDITSSDFLQLLLAQLKNQDPTAPQDPSQSVSQLSSLSQVSTLQDISSELQALLAKDSGNVDLSGSIGHLALIPSNIAAPLADGSYAGAFQAQTEGDVTLTFTGADGQILDSVHVSGPIHAGQAFSWEGTGAPSGGPVSVTVTSPSGPVAVALWTPVTGIAKPYQAAAAQLETSLGLFSPDVVLEIK